MTDSNIIAWRNDPLSAKQLLGRYRRLWHTEHGFRVNKHDLKMLSLPSLDPRRIRAHIAIRFMVFCCIQHLLRHRLVRLGHPSRTEPTAGQYSERINGGGQCQTVRSRKPKESIVST